MFSFKKYFLSLCMMGFSFASNAQVGINTESPRANLDIQGSLGVRNKIYLGGSNAALGKLGESGSVLVSQGVGNAPVWKVIRRPNFDPFIFTIFNNASAETQTGVSIPNTALTGTEIHALNQSLTSFGGVQLTNLQKSFQIDNTGNIAILTFESIAQIASAAQYSGVDFSCGIFVDDLLKGIRVYTVNQPTTSGNPFYTFDLLVAVNNLSVAIHTAKVACKRRADAGGFTGEFAVGQPAGTAANLNAFMMKSSLVIETYEKPDTTNAVPVYNP